MKSSVVFTVSGLSLFMLLNSNAQNAASGGAARPVSPPANSSAGALPPGMQNRGEFRPDRDDLRRGFRNEEQFPQELTGGTNQFGQFTNSMALTNQTALSNQTTLTLQDRAVTPADRALLLRIRQVLAAQVQLPTQSTIQSSVQTSAQSTTATAQLPTASPQSPNSPWMPVHFNVDNGVVTVAGTVASQAQQQQIASLVGQIPGVAQVVDQLAVGTSTTSQLTGTPGQGLLLRVQQNVLPQIEVAGTPAPVTFSMQQQGVVTINGVVTSLAQKHQIAALVRQVPGVIQVNDQTAVNPAAAANGGLNAGTGLTTPQGISGTGNLAPGTAGLTSSNAAGTFLAPTGRTNVGTLPPMLLNPTNTVPQGSQ